MQNLIQQTREEVGSVIKSKFLLYLKINQKEKTKQNNNFIHVPDPEYLNLY